MKTCEIQAEFDRLIIAPGGVATRRRWELRDALLVARAADAAAIGGDPDGLTVDVRTVPLGVMVRYAPDSPVAITVTRWSDGRVSVMWDSRIAGVGQMPQLIRAFLRALEEAKRLQDEREADNAD